MRRTKTRERFICACVMIWENRAVGSKVVVDSAIRKFRIGNNASKFLSRIQGKPEELNRDYFLELFAEYSRLEKEKRIKRKELVDTIEDEETKAAIQERWIKARKDGRGAKKKPDSDLYMTMSFKVNIEQLEKIREIAYRESKFTKEILFEALGDYINYYERLYGEVTPQGKSKAKRG